MLNELLCGGFGGPYTIGEMRDFVVLLVYLVVTVAPRKLILKRTSSTVNWLSHVLAGTAGLRPRRLRTISAGVARIIKRKSGYTVEIWRHYYGNFVKAPARKRAGAPSQTLTSAFDDQKQYELTELGKQFVHYTMNEIVPRIAAAADGASTQTASEPNRDVSAGDAPPTGEQV
jgi:hypothetical protein